METVFVLLFLDDEYGYKDLVGVFSSLDKLKHGFSKLQVNSDAYNLKIHGRIFSRRSLDEFDESNPQGGSYVWKEIKLDQYDLFADRL